MNPDGRQASSQHHAAAGARDGADERKRPVLAARRRSTQPRRSTASWRSIVLLVTGIGLLASCSTAPPLDLRAEAAAASTATDHDALAQAFRIRADQYDADAGYHRKLAARYQESGEALWYRHHDRSELRMAEHCRATADNLTRAAAELRALADEHERLARSSEATSE